MKASELHQSFLQDWHESRQLFTQLIRPHRIWMQGLFRGVKAAIACAVRLHRRAGLLLGVTLVLWVCQHPELPASSPRQKSADQKTEKTAGPRASAPSAKETFHLTFDDGPHPVHTPALLDWLRQNQIRATFFVLGEKAARHPQLVRRMAAEGHVVANHSWSHPNLRLMSTQRLLEEVRRTHDLITAITGKAPALFRPPYGSLSLSQKQLLVKEFGYQIKLWNVDTLDWKLRSSSAVAEVLKTEVRRGSVVLAHDIHGHVLPALQRLLPQWRTAGLEPVPLAAPAAVMVTAAHP